MTTFKFELPDGTLRRVTLTKEDATVAGLRARVLRDMVSVPDVALSYVDGEDEVVAIVTEGDLAEAVAAFEKQGKAVKIRVGQQQQPQQQQQQQPEEEQEPEPEPTLDVKLARALANPTTVQAFHQHLAESTALAQQVAAVADAYLQGGLMEAKDAAVEAAPVLRAVVLEAANNTDPLFGEAVQEVADAMPPTVPPFFFHHPPPFMNAPFFQHAFRAWGGGEGPFGGCVPPPPPFAPGQPSPPPQPPHQHAGVHPFIVCDACEADEDLKKASKMAGNVSVRGWIVGPRHHSTKIQDFDLCASCYNTGRFNATHGPFDVMQPKMAFGPNHFHPHPHHQHHGHRHGGCHPGRFGGPRGCRGSGRQNFADVIAETIGRAASAVAQSADTSAELAQVAKAISESLASSQQQQQQAQQQAQQQQQQQQQQPGVQKMPAQAPEAKRETSSATTTTTNSSDKAHSDDEWTVEEVADPMIRWREQLQRLHDVGFTESEKYIELLEQEKGDLERVINILVRRAA